MRLKSGNDGNGKDIDLQSGNKKGVDNYISTPFFIFDLQNFNLKELSPR